MPTTFTFDVTEEESAGVSARGGRSLQRQYECFTSDIAHEVEVVNALTAQEGVAIGVPHPRWTFAYCVEITPRRDSENYLRWFIDLTYEEAEALPGTVPGMPGGGTTGTTPGGGTGSPHQPPAPGDRPTYYSLDFRSEPIYKNFDLDNKDLVNTAGDYLEDVPPRYQPIGVLRATNFYPTWSFSIGLLAIGRVNQDTWQGFAPDTLLIDSCPAKPVTRGAFTFWQVDWAISYNPDKWVPTRLLNAGRRHRISIFNNAGVFQRFEYEANKDAFGNELPGLQPLKLDGRQAEPADAPVFLDFRFRRRINFNGLITP